MQFTCSMHLLSLAEFATGLAARGMLVTAERNEK